MQPAVMIVTDDKHDCDGLCGGLLPVIIGLLRIGVCCGNLGVVQVKVSTFPPPPQGCNIFVVLFLIVGWVSWQIHVPEPLLVVVSISGCHDESMF